MTLLWILDPGRWWNLSHKDALNIIITFRISNTLLKKKQIKKQKTLKRFGLKHS